MTIFIWLTNLQIETYLIGIWSLIVNALIKLFYSALHNFVFINYNFPEVIKHTIYVLSAIVFPFIIVKILNYDFVKRLLNKYSGKTIHKDIFEDIIDYNKRTLMVVYLKDSNVYYAGTFKVKEENGLNSYITLINYTIKDKSNNDTIIDTELLELKSSIVFNLQDVEHIQIIYEDDSKVWCWLNENNMTRC